MQEEDWIAKTWGAEPGFKGAWRFSETALDLGDLSTEPSRINNFS
jgi:hypothetical protein